MTHPIHLTPLGHSCVLVEVIAGDGGATRLLLDPGTLTPPLDPIAHLDAILITHAHPDHAHAEQIQRLRAEAPVPVYGDAATADLLAADGIDDVIIIDPGVLAIAGVAIEVSSWVHEQIYPGVPLPADYGYEIAGRVFAPGDAFAIPEHPVEVLLLPTGAPWMKVSEAIDYMKAVAPRVVVPVHDGGLATAHREMHRGLMQKFAPEGTTVLRPAVGEQISFPA